MPLSRAALPGRSHGGTAERLPAAAGTRPRQAWPERDPFFPIPNQAPPLANPVDVTLRTCPPPRSADRVHRHKRHTKGSANLRDFMSPWNT